MIIPLIISLVAGVGVALLGIVCAMQSLDIQRLQTQLQQLHQQLQQEQTTVLSRTLYHRRKP